MLPRTIFAVFGMAVFAVNFAEARQAKPTTDALSHAESCAASQTVGDIKSVVAAGKVIANQYSNEYFGLSVTAYNGEIQAPVFVNAEAQRARLMDAFALLKVHPFRYSMGVLVDSCAKNPLIYSLEQYVRAVSHQLTKESVETLEPIREEFPIDISGVRFVGTVMKVSIRGQVYYRGVYATFLNGYIFGLDVKADDTERLQELLISMIRLQGKDVTAQSSAASKTTQSTAAESYPNTADGLHSLLIDLLAVAKGDDEGKVWSKIAQMEIPDYENWFTRTYGQEKGQALAGAYGKSLKLSEQQFEMLWVELAKQEGEITINKLDAASRRFDLAKKDDALANPTDEFKADWKKTDSSAGPARQAIGYFCFVDGKFRLKSFPHEVQILSTTKPGPIVPGKLINRVQPMYPETARKLRLRGMVSINVVIHKDGTVTVQNVGAGHPLLAPAAITAVQQWKYEPTTVSGEPVDVLVKVYVTFEFSQQQSEQKQ
jgi:TonB family protein